MMNNVNRKTGACELVYRTSMSYCHGVPIQQLWHTAGRKLGTNKMEDGLGHLAKQLQPAKDDPMPG